MEKITFQKVGAVIAVVSYIVYMTLDYQELKSAHGEFERRVERLEARSDARGVHVNELDKRMIRMEEKQDLILLRLDEIRGKL